MISLQHGCCLSCHCPVKDSLHMYNDEVVNRSIAYIERALKNESSADEDAITDDKADKVDLIGVKHDAHIVHKTHCIPALEKFISGEWKDVWFEDELPKSSEFIDFGDTPSFKSAIEAVRKEDNVAVLRIEKNEKKRNENTQTQISRYALFWEKPENQNTGFKRMANLITSRCTKMTNPPELTQTYITCQKCNSAMSQQLIFRQLLVSIDKEHASCQSTFIPKNKIVKIEGLEKLVNLTLIAC